MNNQHSEIMSVKQLAKYLGVSTVWIYLHYREKIPHFRLGRKLIRFYKTKIDEAIDRGELTRGSFDRTPNAG